MSSSISCDEILVGKNHMKSMLSHMHSGKGKAGYKNLKPFKTRLISFTSTNSSAANTALEVNNAITMTAGTFGDLADVTGLFDEMRVLKGRLYYTFSTVTSGAGTTPLIAQCAVVFDPNLAAPTNSNQVLIQTYHSKPIAISPGGGTVVAPYFGEIMHTLNFKMPSPIAPISSSDTIGSAWFTLDAGTPPEILSVQAYVGPLGALGVSNFYYILELDIELRIRT